MCRDLAAEVAAGCGPLTAAVADALVDADDDDLDAVLCALVARAVVAGDSSTPGADDLVIARREGWIHLPTVSLAEVSAHASLPSAP